MSTLKYTFAVVLGAFLVLAVKSADAQPFGTAIDCPVGQECIIEQISVGGVLKEQRRILSNGNTVWEALNASTGLLEPLLWVQHTKEVSTDLNTGILHVGKWTAFHTKSYQNELGQNGNNWVEMRIGGTPENPEGNMQGVGWIGVDKTQEIIYFGGENSYKPALVTTDLVSPHLMNSADVVAVFDWKGMRLYQQNGTTRLDINGTSAFLKSSLTIEAADGGRSLLIQDTSGNWRASWKAYPDGGVWKMQERLYNGLVWEQLP